MADSLWLPIVYRKYVDDDGEARADAEADAEAEVKYELLLE